MWLFVEFVNDFARIFIDSTGLMLIQSSVLIAILLGLDRLLRRHMRAVLRYCIWMLVLVKLVLPSSLSMPFSMGYWVANGYDSILNSQPENLPTQIVINPASGFTESILEKPTLQNATTQEEGDTYLASDSPNPTTPTLAQTAPVLAGENHATTETGGDEPLILPALETVMAHDAIPVLTWQAILFVLWCVVCLITGLTVLQKTLVIRRLVRLAPPANRHLNKLFQSCCKQVLPGRPAELRVSPVIPTPAVCGLFRPKVLFPERALSHALGTRELETIFVHELIHIQRGDIWVKLLQTILQVVYFYNPLLWLANATIRRVRELAVDETVLVTLGKPTNEVYPRTLLKVAAWTFDRPTHGLRLIGVMESTHLLTERIKIMLNKPTPHTKDIGIIGLASLFLMAVFLLPMARARIEKAPPEISKEPAEIQSMKAEIESLQKLIQMKLDALHKREVQLGLRQPATTQPRKNQPVIGAMMGGMAGPEKPLPEPVKAGSQAEVTPRNQPDAMGGMMMGGSSRPDSVPPVDAQPGRTRGRTGGGMGGSMMGGSSRSDSTAPADAQPANRGGMMGGGMGGMMMGGGIAADSAPRADTRPARRGGMMGGGVGGMVIGGDMAADSTPPANTRPARRGGMMGGGMTRGAKDLPSEPLKEPSMFDDEVIPSNLSDEVRKELQRILPGLLREMLPKLFQEAQIKAAEESSQSDESLYTY